LEIIGGNRLNSRPDERLNCIKAMKGIFILKCIMMITMMMMMMVVVELDSVVARSLS